VQNIWPPRIDLTNAGAPEVRGDVEPVSGAMGAYVHGYDVTALDDASVGEILDLVHRYKAVMLRSQPEAMTLDQYRSFGQQLGELALDPYVEPAFADHPEIMGLIRSAEDTARNFGGDWHSDGSYLPRPGGYTVLWGRKVPPVGGDTLFANLALAWESLSPEYRKMLDGRRCIHAASGSGDKIDIVRKGDYAKVNAGVLDEKRTEHAHPIRRTHPVTGESSLFVNESYSTCVEGWTEDESAGVLGFLFRFSTSPALTARLVWEPGTVLLWDNRTTAHFAIMDYGGHDREMYRLAVKGEVPV